MHGWLAGTINNDSTYNPKAVPCGPARSDHLHSSEVLGDCVPHPSCVICTHLGAKAQPHYMCGWTRCPHTRASRPHACIFSHAKATRHTLSVNKSMKQKGRARQGMQCATNTALQPLPHPHLKHSRKASKEQTLCPIKSCVSSCSAAQTHNLSDGVGCSGGTLLLPHQMLQPEPPVWSAGAEVSLLHGRGSPSITAHPTEEHKSHREPVRGKTLSQYRKSWAANE